MKPDAHLRSWLLEPETPAVRYRALISLLGLLPGHPQVQEARQAIADDPQVRKLLAAQKTSGYWVQPDYYVPKHYSTFWVLSVLADLGLTREDEHIRQGCDYLFTHQRPEGSFCWQKHISGQGICWEKDPDTCTQSRIIHLLIQAGYRDDPRTRNGFAWLFHTQRNDSMWLCNWPGRGCLRATLDFLRAAVLDPEIATHPATARAAEVVCGLLMEPNMGRYHVSDEWTILTYPYFGYGVIPALETLAQLGYTLSDPIISRAVQYLLGRRLPDGTWPLDKMQPRSPLDFGRASVPNKWITLDSLIALQRLIYLDQ